MIDFSEEVLAKAHMAIAEDRLKVDEEHPLIWWVQGNDPTKRYRVQVGMVSGSLLYVTCTCPHGMLAGAGMTHCYHAAAVLILLKEKGVKVDG